MPGSAVAAAPPAQANAVNLTALFNTATSVEGSHRTIAQTLNKWKAYDGRQLLYALENFEGTEAAWDAVPAIYAQDHPDMDLFDADPEAALAAIATVDGEPGRIVGYHSESAILVAGQPRLEMQVNFTDAAVETRYDAGELAPSTGFRVKEINPDGTLDGTVRPHHVLYFVQDRRNQPRDQGAMLLNKEDHVTDPQDPNAGTFRSFLHKLKALLNTLPADAAGEAETVANQAAPGATPIPLDDSLEVQRQRLHDALKAVVNPRWSDGTEGWLDVEATFADSVIYRHCSGDGTAYRIPYAVENGAYTFGVPVVVEQTYIESASPAPPAAAPDLAVPVPNKEAEMDKTTYDQELAIANKAAADAKTELANKETEITSLKEQLTNKDTELANLKATVATFEQEREDGLFGQFLNKIKPALYEKPEDRTALRQKWDADKTALLLNLDTMLLDPNAATPRTGDAAVPLGNTAAANTTVGSFNPATGGYE